MTPEKQLDDKKSWEPPDCSECKAPISIWDAYLIIEGKPYCRDCGEAMMPTATLH